MGSTFCPQSATCSLAWADLPAGRGVVVALIAASSSRAQHSLACPAQPTALELFRLPVIVKKYKNVVKCKHLLLKFSQSWIWFDFNQL